MMGTREGGDISYRDMVEESTFSPVRQFYEGSNVFITGSTGFMGKVLIEKLLRSCPGIDKMYLLARSKKGKDAAERFKEQFEDPLYEVLRREQPDFSKKICIVEGDAGSLKLGLSDDDYARVLQDVNVFFHGAATVRFDERLRQAVRVNVRGTREALVMASKMPNLSAFVHISTAYSNCVVKEIDEVFYDPPLMPEKLIDLVETLDEEMLHKMTSVLIDKFPNTYAYTKMIAETVVKDLSHGLPVAMVRPAIIIATYREPVRGWIDNVYGPTGVVVGAGVGLLRTLHCDEKIVAEMVPIDYVINATIVAGYDVGTNHNAPNKEQPLSSNGTSEVAAEEKKVPIYNYVSSNESPVTWGEFMSLVEKHGLSLPTVLAVWCYFFTLNKHKSIHSIYAFFLHIVPGYLVDTVAFCIGKQPMLVKSYKKIHKFSNVISYFCTNQWTFKNENTKDLFKKLTNVDKQIFDFDAAKIDWGVYLKTYVQGLRRYVLKDPDSTLDQAKKKLVYLTFLHYSVGVFLLLGVFKLLYLITNIIIL